MVPECWQACFTDSAKYLRLSVSIDEELFVKSDAQQQQIHSVMSQAIDYQELTSYKLYYKLIQTYIDLNCYQEAMASIEQLRVKKQQLTQSDIFSELEFLQIDFYYAYCLMRTRYYEESMKVFQDLVPQVEI